jgi:hypothetical protein
MEAEPALIRTKNEFYSIHKLQSGESFKIAAPEPATADLVFPKPVGLQSNFVCCKMDDD